MIKISLRDAHVKSLITSNYKFLMIFQGRQFLPRHFFSTCRMIIILPIESYSGNDSEGSYDPNDILFKPETAQ